MAELHLNQTDNNKTVPAHVGDAVVIRLYETATGYKWELASFTEETLTFEGVTSRQDEIGTPIPEQPGAAGAGGLAFNWKFAVKAPGPGSLSLKYWRGYENEDSVFRYTVNFKIS